VQFVQHFLFFIQGEIWNLDHLVTCGIPRMQIHTEFRGIPGNFTAKNTAEFRMFLKKFRIPAEVKHALPSEKA
jgi:hypothetical protein